MAQPTTCNECGMKVVRTVNNGDVTVKILGKDGKERYIFGIPEDFGATRPQSLQVQPCGRHLGEKGECDTEVMVDGDQAYFQPFKR